MFCEKCGKPIPEGQTACPACDAVAETVPEEILASVAPEAPQESEFTLSTLAEEAPKPKKGGKIALMVVAAVLAVAVFLVAFNWQSIYRFFDRSFSTPEDYLARVEKDAAAAAAANLADAYDAYLTNAPQGDTKTVATFKLEAGDSLKTLLGGALGMEGALDWLNDITFTYTTESYEDVDRVDVAAALNGTHILTLSIVSDYNKNQLYMGVPELNATFLRMDLDEYTVGIINDDMETFLTECLVNALPSGDELETMLNTYLGILIDSFTDCTKENQKVRCGGLEQELLVITTRLDEEDVLDLFEKLLQRVKEDQTVQAYFAELETAVLEAIGEEVDYAAQFDAWVEESLAQIETWRTEVEEGNYLLLETFIDGEDRVVGRRFEMFSADKEETEEAYFVTVTQGKEFAFQLRAGRLCVEGKGTEDGGKINAAYTLVVDGTTYLTVELEDFTLQEGVFGGKVRLLPTSALGAVMDLPDSVVNVLNTVAVEISSQEDADRIAVSVSGSEMMVLTISASIEPAAEIALPEGVNPENSVALARWFLAMDTDSIMDSLENAGVPQDYVELLAEMVAELFS